MDFLLPVNIWPIFPLPTQGSGAGSMNMMVAMPLTRQTFSATCKTALAATPLPCEPITGVVNFGNLPPPCCEAMSVRTIYSIIGSTTLAGGDVVAGFLWKAGCCFWMFFD